MHVVSGTGLTKAFAGTPALAGVDLRVSRGSVHGLLGPNGAGKTTLLRVLLGLVRLDSGDLHVEGTVGGFVENPGAYGYLTGRQNLELLADLDDEPGDVQEVLGRVDLLGRADTRVSGWSLGMRQRLGIAAGLLRRPDLLVLDEPANGLDPRGERALRSLVRELAADGLTVLLCSHDLAEVDALCGEVTVLARGSVLYAGTTADLRSRSGGGHELQTSDDVRALALAAGRLGCLAVPGGLLLTGDQPDVDAYVLQLGRADIAVRRLVQQDVPLEQAFLELTR